MQTFEIVLSHAWSERLSAAFPEFVCRSLDARHTALTGELHDQSELQSVISRIGTLGLEIEHVRRIDDRRN